MLNRKELSLSSPSFQSPYLIIGEVRSSHGLKGEFYVHLYSKDCIDHLKNLKSKALKKVKFFKKNQIQASSIEDFRPFKKGLLIKLSHLHSIEDALSYKSFQMGLLLSLMTSTLGEKIYLHEILNFKVRLKGGPTIGFISGFSSNGVQDLILLETPEGTKNIPLVDEFISKTSFKDKFLEMDFPEGILSL